MNATEYGSLVGSLYSVVADAAELATFQNEVCRVFEGASSSFIVADRATGYRSYDANAVPRPHVERYLEAIQEDPWVVEGANKVLRPMAIRGTDLIAQRLYRKSRVYADFLRPIDLEYLLACGTSLADDFSALLTILRTKRRGDFDTLETKAMGLLTPHVVRVSRLILDQKFGRSTLAGLAMLKIDSHGVVDANPQAEELIQSTDLIEISRNRLCIRGDQDDQRLRFRLRRLLQGDYTVPCGSAEPIHVSSDRERLSLFLFPTSSVDLALVHRDYGVVVEMVLTRIDDRVAARESAVNASRLVDRFGLTRAESELVCALLADESMRFYAERKCRSIHTVRTQLKSAMHKIGARTQLQLARRVLEAMH